jgi:hypothetical protein
MIYGRPKKFLPLYQLYPRNSSNRGGAPKGTGACTVKKRRPHSGTFVARVACPSARSLVLARVSDKKPAVSMAGAPPARLVFSTASQLPAAPRTGSRGSPGRRPEPPALAQSDLGAARRSRRLAQLTHLLIRSPLESAVSTHPVCSEYGIASWVLHWYLV